MDPIQGDPKLFFSTSLNNHHPRGVLSALRVYSYPEEADGKPVCEKPIKDGISDHACDALRYYIVARLPSRSRLRMISYSTL